MGWLRRHYGAGPIHLAGLLACFAIAAYALAKVLHEDGWKKIVVLFALCIVLHDLVIWPVYGLADRIALRIQDRTRDRRPALVPWINYLRVPTVISALLLAMFFPLILRASNSEYQAATGLDENIYIFNWLAVTAVLYVGSASAYLLRLWRATSRVRRTRSD
jgi:hypothetical protein